MNTEYLNLSEEEVIYGEKELLQIQLEMLKATQFSRNYKTLRNEEYAVKIVLKSKIEEIRKILDGFDKMLPKTSLEEEQSLTPEEVIKSEKENLSLEQEIEEIRQKLQRISNKQF